MPIYDYTCGRCGHLAEFIHGIHDEGPKFCPNCGAEGTMRKGFTAPTVVFKGSGWARKDRGGGSKSRTAKGGESDSAGAGAGGAAETKTSTTSSAATGGAAASGDD